MCLAGNKMQNFANTSAWNCHGNKILFSKMAWSIVYKNMIVTFVLQ